MGLGKTIEAGIILTELNARSSLDHVLVACPSPLTVKWKREMRERFLLDFDILDGASFREFVRSDEHGPSPEPRRVIASLELMRREENLDALLDAQPRLDVVVVDEAHHARNTETSTHGLVDLLSGLTETLIFLTATPLNLGRQDFFNLMRLLVPDEFPSFETFQDVIAPNKHLNNALRALRVAPPRFDDALAALRGVERTASAERFGRSPAYRSTLEVLRRGADGEEIERDRVVQCQRTLIDLNPLSHIFTRTRKREVQELFPTRRAHPIRVSFDQSPSQTSTKRATNWALNTTVGTQDLDVVDRLLPELHLHPHGLLAVLGALEKRNRLVALAEGRAGP